MPKLPRTVLCLILYKCSYEIALRIDAYLLFLLQTSAEPLTGPLAVPGE